MAAGEILYLSYDGMSDPLGQSQVLPYLFGLTAKGYRFHLISFEKPEQFVSQKSELEQLISGAGIFWNPLPYTKNPPVLSTMMDLNSMLKKAESIIKSHDIKIVHCRSYISGMAGLQLQQKFGIRMIFDMRGFWADERIDGGIWKLSNPIYYFIYRYFKRKEKEMLQRADAVISLTENAKTEIDSWNVRPAQKLPVSVIPCCTDMQLFNPENISENRRNELMAELKIKKEQTVLTYLGAIGTWYLLDEMLKFFAVFLERYPDSIFLFITREDESMMHQSAAKFKIPSDSIRIRKAARKEVPELLSLGQASVFFIKPSFSKKASSPTKQGEIMSMGIPVICNTGVGDTDWVIKKYGSGLLVDVAKPVSYGNAVDQFEQLLNIPKIAIIRGAKEFYSLQSGIEKYAAVYTDLLKNQAG